MLSISSHASCFALEVRLSSMVLWDLAAGWKSLCVSLFKSIDKIRFTIRYES